MCHGLGCGPVRGPRERGKIMATRRIERCVECGEVFHVHTRVALDSGAIEAGCVCGVTFLEPDALHPDEYRVIDGVNGVLHSYVVTQ